MIGGLVGGNYNFNNDIMVPGGVSGNYRSDIRSLPASQYSEFKEKNKPSTVLNLKKNTNSGQQVSFSRNAGQSVPFSRSLETQPMMGEKNKTTQKLQQSVPPGKGTPSVNAKFSASNLNEKNNSVGLKENVAEDKAYEKKLEVLKEEMKINLLAIESHLEEMTKSIVENNENTEFRMSNYDTSYSVIQQEVEQLREEIQYASIGRIKAVVRGDTNLYVEKSVNSDIQETVLAGSHVWLQSPYDENSEGIWATKQTLSVTDNGLELKGIYCLIASSNGENKFEPLVDVVSSE
jgi:hypothetical protein